MDTLAQLLRPHRYCEVVERLGAGNHAGHSLGAVAIVAALVRAVAARWPLCRSVQLVLQAPVRAAARARAAGPVQLVLTHHIVPLQVGEREGGCDDHNRAEDVEHSLQRTELTV